MILMSSTWKIHSQGSHLGQATPIRKEPKPKPFAVLETDAIPSWNTVTPAIYNYNFRSGLFISKKSTLN